MSSNSKPTPAPSHAGTPWIERNLPHLRAYMRSFAPCNEALGYVVTNAKGTCYPVAVLILGHIIRQYMPRSDRKGKPEPQYNRGQLYFEASYSYFGKLFNTDRATATRAVKRLEYLKLIEVHPFKKYLPGRVDPMQLIGIRPNIERIMAKLAEVGVRVGNYSQDKSPQADVNSAHTPAQDTAQPRAESTDTPLKMQQHQESESERDHSARVARSGLTPSATALSGDAAAEERQPWAICPTDEEGLMKQGIYSTGWRGPSLLGELDRTVQCPSDLRTEMVRRLDELRELNKLGELRVSDEMLREYEELAHELRSKGTLCLSFDQAIFLNSLVKEFPIAAEVEEFWRIRAFHSYPPPLEAFARYWMRHLGPKGFGSRVSQHGPEMMDVDAWNKFWQKYYKVLWNLDAVANGKVVTLESLIATVQ